MASLVSCKNLGEYIYGSVTAEAGSSFTAEVFRKQEGVALSFTGFFADKYVTDGQARVTHPGSYVLDLLVDDEVVNVYLTVVDTTAPEGRGIDREIWDKAVVKPEDCVTEIRDNTEVTCSFDREIDFSAVGVFDVNVVLTDEGGNTTQVPVVLTLRNFDSLLSEGITIEAGDKIPQLTSLLEGRSDCRYLTDIDAISTYYPDTYMLEVEIGQETYELPLVIKDTVAPQATITAQYVYRGGSVPQAESFVSDIVDAGPVTISYVEVPDITQDGDAIPTQIMLIDQAGNTSIYDTEVVFAVDNEAPVFTKTASKLTMNMGGSLSWKSAFEAEDNSEQVYLRIELGDVDTNIPGTYTVKVVAYDLAGNETETDVKLVVFDTNITVEKLDAVINKIFKKIITEDMTREEQVAAVYKYITWNLRYTKDGDHDDEVKQAYLGLTSRGTGDCYTFYAVGSEMLKRLGFDVIMLRRRLDLVPGRGNHFWCYVNMGDEDDPQWYHFDACPHGVHPCDTHLLTDEQVWAYTNLWNDRSPGGRHYYTYDKTGIPEPATKRFYEIDLDPKYYEKYYPPRGFASAE